MNNVLSDEHDLLEGARLRDESAFGELVIAYTPVLFRIVRRMVTDTMEAEAILQETFWRFWQALPRYHADRPLLPYLATIASNLARDRYRRERRVEDVDVEDVLESRRSEPNRSLERSVDEKKTLDGLAEAVQALPFAYRAVIALRYEAEMSYEEIAEALSLPLNTVRTHLRRAKQILRRQIEDTGGR